MVEMMVKGLRRVISSSCSEGSLGLRVEGKDCRVMRLEEVRWEK